MQKTQKLKEHAGPEVPEWAQHRREHAAVEHRAESGGGEGIQPQLSVAHAQSEEKPRKREEEAKERIERIRQARAAPPQPQRAQQVVEQGERHASEHCRGEQAELAADRDLHASGAENA